MPIAYALDRVATIDRTIAVGGDVGHAQVNPKQIMNVLWSGLRYDARCQQIPCAASVKKVSFAPTGLEQAYLAHTTDYNVPWKLDTKIG